MIAEHQVQAATRGLRLRLELVEQPEDFGVVRTAIEHVAEHREMAAAETPFQRAIDDAVLLQQLDENFEFAVRVRHHEQRRACG